jgi:resuscitation-promoting factor RpfB
LPVASYHKMASEQKPLVRKRLGLASLCLVLIGCLLLVWGLRKDVTLVVDGQNRALTTYAFTVGSLLHSAQIAITPQDYLQPPTDQWLKDGAVVVVEHAVPVQILADGRISTLVSYERLPINLLAIAGIQMEPGDELLSEGQPVPIDQSLAIHNQPISLQVRRNIAYSLREDSKVLALNSKTVSLGQALWEANIQLFSADRLYPPSNTPLTAGLEALLVRARPVTIHTDTGSISLLTAAYTVGEALADAGLAPQGLDYSIPAAEDVIPEDREIRLVRVQEEVIIEQSPVEFETTYQPASEVEIDNQTILQQGEYGLTARRIRIRYENGQEVSRQTESEWVAKQPLARIVGYGTKIVQHTLDTPDGPIQYWRALTMWATSYSPSSAGGSITATGDTVQKGIVGINPNYIPYGTRMYIPGYGIGKASDTGNIGPRWIDLGYSDDDYVSWHQYVTVYFLWPPPDNIVWIIP